MRLRLLALAAIFAATPALLAQSTAWQPAPGHITLYLWPHGAPGEPAHPAPEVNLTKPNAGLVAGRTVTIPAASRDRPGQP